MSKPQLIKLAAAVAGYSRLTSKWNKARGEQQALMGSRIETIEHGTVMDSEFPQNIISDSTSQNRNNHLPRSTPNELSPSLHPPMKGYSNLITIWLKRLAKESAIPAKPAHAHASLAPEPMWIYYRSQGFMAFQGTRLITELDTFRIRDRAERLPRIRGNKSPRLGGIVDIIVAISFIFTVLTNLFIG